MTTAKHHGLTKVPTLPGVDSHRGGRTTRQRNLGRFTVRMTGNGGSGRGRRQEGRRSTVRLWRQRWRRRSRRWRRSAMEEVPGPTVVVAATEERERREVREGEMGLAIPRWRRIWTRFQIPGSPTGRRSRRNKVADGDHGRGLLNNGEDGDGEDGRRSLHRERREEIEQRGGGAGERRPWKEKRREVVGFKNPATAAERDGEGRGERRRCWCSARVTEEGGGGI